MRIREPQGSGAGLPCFPMETHAYPQAERILSGSGQGEEGQLRDCWLEGEQGRGSHGSYGFFKDALCFWFPSHSCFSRNLYFHFLRFFRILQGTSTNALCNTLPNMQFLFSGKLLFLILLFVFEHYDLEFWLPPAFFQDISASWHCNLRLNFLEQKGMKNVFFFAILTKLFNKINSEHVLLVKLLTVSALLI